jgi:hypothetical protein
MNGPKDRTGTLRHLLGALALAAVCVSVPTLSSALASADESDDPSQETSTTVTGLEDLLGSVDPKRTLPTQDPDYLWDLNTQIRQQLTDSTADQLATAASEESARLQELGNQASRDDREASSTAFVDASPQEAKALLNQNFGEIIQAASSTPLDAIEDENVTSFRGDQVATLQAAGAQPAELAVSTTPMRVPGENGDLAPIDLDLTFQGGSWSTRNGQVDLEVPASSSGTVEVGPVNFDVALPGEQTSNSTSLGNSARFYPEIGPDTDMVVSATSEGAEVFFSLRSPLSPETQTLNFDIPAGAQLTETPTGSFEMTSGETVIARIPAPVAFDSNGTSVPVEASVDDGDLTLTTEHRGRDLAYPILVDPIIDTIASASPTVRRFSEAVDNEGNLIAPYGGWYAGDSGGSLDNYAASGAFGDGLYIDDPVASGPPHGGVWIWVAPPGSAELTRVDFGPYGLALNGDTSSAGGGMILGTATEEGMAAELHTADVSNGYTTIYSADAEGDPSPTDFALFALLRIKFGSTVGDNDHSAYLGGAVARLGDSAGATLAGELGAMGTETIDAGWTNSSDTMTVPMEATDSGLGVKKLEAVAVDENDETVVLGSYVDPCLGGAASPCPETLANDVDLDMSLIDEGRYTIKFRAYDALLQTAGGPNLEMGIDRTQPAEYRFYFGGNTLNTRQDLTPMDPINVIFYSPNGEYGENEIVTDIDRVIPNYKGKILDSNQWLMFTTAAGRHSNTRYREVDRAVATEYALVNRDHIRLWGDDSAANMLNRQSGVWVVGSVHHDYFSRDARGHRVDIDWDISRRKFASQMIEGQDHGRCVDGTWRRHPLARGWFGDSGRSQFYHYSSGIIARVTKQSRRFGCRGA